MLHLTLNKTIVQFFTKETLNFCRNLITVHLYKNTYYFPANTTLPQLNLTFPHKLTLNFTESNL
jgi:hypothetical protein